MSPPPSRLTQSQLVARLRYLLAHDALAVMPCCFDGLNAKLIERAGFDVAFMTGFGVSAVHGLPDTQLLSFVRWSAAPPLSASLCAMYRGYGRYHAGGPSGPKRCGHTTGKAVVSREEAFARVRAAVDARREGQFDLVIMARTDARGTHSLDEAIARCNEFARLGADITFLEAPQSVEEMETYCREVPGPKMVNMVENGLTPVLLPEQLGQMGYNLAAYPITLLSASIKAMEEALRLLKYQTGGERKEDTGENATPSAELDNLLCDFAHVRMSWALRSITWRKHVTSSEGAGYRSAASTKTNFQNARGRAKRRTPFTLFSRATATREAPTDDANLASQCTSLKRPHSRKVVLPAPAQTGTTPISLTLGKQHECFCTSIEAEQSSIVRKLSEKRQRCGDPVQNTHCECLKTTSSASIQIFFLLISSTC
ncbi:Pyruvate/Phosphoenolpyruvate kinase-like domain [Phytophthora cactorum]|nr:Pyruvate/Phosphoenolpyruvate kinase-like domain [Phytophthora cactorum]